jgi:DNA-binding transcriptional LysR family regulator
LKRGLGVTVCPEVCAQEELRAKRLARLRWDAEAMETSILMIWHAEKWCSPLLSHFMAIAIEVITA